MTQDDAASAAPPSLVADRPPVLVRDWWDVFAFDTSDVRVICPDCDELSPEFEHIWAAVQWVDAHYKVCSA
jgi:hypothetical protein